MLVFLTDNWWRGCDTGSLMFGVVFMVAQMYVIHSLFVSTVYA